MNDGQRSTTEVPEGPAEPEATGLAEARTYCDGFEALNGGRRRLRFFRSRGSPGHARTTNLDGWTGLRMCDDDDDDDNDDDEHDLVRILSLLLPFFLPVRRGEDHASQRGGAEGLSAPVRNSMAELAARSKEERKCAHPSSS